MSARVGRSERSVFGGTSEILGARAACQIQLGKTRRRNILTVVTREVWTCVQIERRSILLARSEETLRCPTSVSETKSPAALESNGARDMRSKEPGQPLAPALAWPMATRRAAAETSEESRW